MGDSRKLFRIDDLLAKKQKGSMNHSNKNLADTCCLAIQLQP